MYCQTLKLLDESCPFSPENFSADAHGIKHRLTHQNFFKLNCGIKLYFCFSVQISSFQNSIQNNFKFNGKLSILKYSKVLEYLATRFRTRLFQTWCTRTRS